jgi:hypothetical protein
MNYWIIIAGPSKARVFSTTGHYDTLHFLRQIEPRYAASLVSAPTDSGISAGYPRESFVSPDEATADFAHELVDQLDAAFQRGEFHLFTLVAPRRFLDLVVRLLNPVLDRHLRKCVAEDYQALAAEQLQPLVQTMLPNAALI